LDIRFSEIKKENYLMELVKREREFILLVNLNSDINLKNTVIKIEEENKENINAIPYINNKAILEESYI